MQNIEFLKGKIEEKKWQVQGFRRGFKALQS